MAPTDEVADKIDIVRPGPVGCMAEPVRAWGENDDPAGLDGIEDDASAAAPRPATPATPTPAAAPVMAESR